jgi:glycosyltransferase involved in cell wall biosynthesis
MNDLNNSLIKVKYLHGRPSAHFTHANFAKSINADFEFIDFKYRWQDKKRNIFYIIFSWFYCAKNYTNRQKYDIFLVDNLHFSPIIMKYLFLKRKRQKVVVYLGSHTMYFMYAKKFSRINLIAHKIILKSYDAIICEGEMAKFFVQTVLKRRTPLIYTVFNGIPDSQNLSFASNRAVKIGKKLLFIGSYNNEFRFEYKGIDIMLKAFEIAFKQDNELRFTLVGHPYEKLLNPILDSMDKEARKAVTILDYTSNLEEVIFEHNIYLHCSRGDAFPTTVLIALSAGMPAIVNELNGTKEVVARINSNLVTTQDPENIAGHIIWFLGLTDLQKEKIMRDAQLISKEYTESKAVDKFRSVFEQLEKEIFRSRN